jgi:hypothetical protein
VLRAGQGLVTAARHVRNPKRGLVALALNAITAEQVGYQHGVARRVKVKLTKACLLEFCFGDINLEPLHACEPSPLVLMCGMASVLIGPRFANSGMKVWLPTVAKVQFA